MSINGFGQRLRTARTERGLTQRELANKLGITEQAVSKWERGANLPDTEMLDGISQVLDCSLDYLFQYERGKKDFLDQDDWERREAICRQMMPDMISLRFGQGLVDLFVGEMNAGFPHVDSLRRQIASQWGILIPPIRIMDQLALGEAEYELCLHGERVLSGEVEEFTESTLEEILGKVKGALFANLSRVVNNQTIHDMVQYVGQQVPYAVQGIVPEVVSYSLLREVVIALLSEEGMTVCPMLLILQCLERIPGTACREAGQGRQDALPETVRALAAKVAEELGEGYRLENWV